MSVSKLVCALVSQCEVRKGVFRGVYTRRSLINYLTSRKNVSHGKIRCNAFLWDHVISICISFVYGMKVEREDS